MHCFLDDHVVLFHYILVNENTHRCVITFLRSKYVAMRSSSTSALLDSAPKEMDPQVLMHSRCLMLGVPGKFTTQQGVVQTSRQMSDPGNSFYSRFEDIWPQNV